MDLEREWYRQRASRITALAHVFGILALILMLVWLLHFRGGISLDSAYPDRVLNTHPFLMYFGFIFFAGQAMMAYKTVIAEIPVQKTTHMLLHVVAMTVGIIGIYAAFKYHDLRGLTNMYSLHSWIGLSTFILYGIQWMAGFATFWLPTTPISTRATALPWHVSLGRALLYMAICAAETGLMQLFTILKLVDDHEARLVNFTALVILLFGISVDVSIAFGRHSSSF